VNQKSVRASCGSVPGSRPSDHGMLSASISTATPTVQICHITMVMSEAKAISGVCLPGFSFFQVLQVKSRPYPVIHDPTTTRVRPM